MTSTVVDMMNKLAQNAGKTTILQHAPTGGTLVWVTDSEMLPMRALVQAALAIIAHRGLPPPHGVDVRRLEVAAEGAEYYWQYADTDGNTVAYGYAPTESDAYAALAAAIAKKSA